MDVKDLSYGKKLQCSLYRLCIKASLECYTSDKKNLVVVLIIYCNVKN